LEDVFLSGLEGVHPHNLEENLVANTSPKLAASAKLKYEQHVPKTNCTSSRRRKNTSPKRAASAKLKYEEHVLHQILQQASARFNFGEVSNFAKVESLPTHIGTDFATATAIPKFAEIFPNRMKKVLSVALFLLIGLTIGYSQTAKMEVFELGAQADLIVTGKIKMLDSKAYTFEIDKVVAGSYANPTIVVQRFHNTKTAKRWGKYVLAESMMLWLKTDGTTNTILGENGEGEKMLFNGDVYLDSRGGALKNTFGNHAPYPGSAIYAEKVNAEQFVAAVKDTKDCFSLDIEEKKSPEGEVMFKRFAVKKLEDKQYDEIRGRGWMHDNIIANGEKHVR
jgi:hypothetical protein